MDRNFGEELVYWYLRLNGFFIINNFVLHHDTASRTSDADLLAVRFPYVYEDIGGREEDWDATLLSHFPKGSIIGLICEVKTGLNFNRENIFCESNLYKALGRFGFISGLNSYIRELSMSSKIEVENYQVSKVLFSRKKVSPRTDCIHIKLVHVKQFIKNRMTKYMDRKLADRMFFPSSLLQYIIWEENLRENRRREREER
ncbi:hypothetical protein E2R60_29900 [Paenibacillus dendritiformis]|uniref:hypothetical protein n=1 Tax=Paenibacillus dendritiformis TaxID=130049 RepID=UPI00105A2B6F|nr:hypothetical protein [Paenibacillus dendritiformis]TDL47397.1 hypothetical protein E2R60_29900 [Paenibacillus dendritiformis]